MHHVGSWWRSDLIRLELTSPAYLWEALGISQANMGPAGFLEFQGALLRGPQTSLLVVGGGGLVVWVALVGFNYCLADRTSVALNSLYLDC